MICIFVIMSTNLGQGEEGSNPSIKFEKTHYKGGKIMNKKNNDITFSLKLTLEFTTLFNLVLTGNFLV